MGGNRRLLSIHKSSGSKLLRFCGRSAHLTRPQEGKQSEKVSANGGIARVFIVCVEDGFDESQRPLPSDEDRAPTRFGFTSYATTALCQRKYPFRPRLYLLTLMSRHRDLTASKFSHAKATASQLMALWGLPLGRKRYTSTSRSYNTHQQLPDHKIQNMIVFRTVRSTRARKYCPEGSPPPENLSLLVHAVKTRIVL